MSHRRILITIGSVLVVLIIVMMVRQFFLLRQAHSTFENYYSFRGCAQLMERTETYGVCKTNSSQTIKIVKYQNKWFLDGDLPWGCVGKICFGW